MTFLDSIFDKIQKENKYNIKQNLLIKLHAYLQSQNYDTDSIIYDLIYLNKESNIKNEIKDVLLIQSVKTYTRSFKCMCVFIFYVNSL